MAPFGARAPAIGRSVQGAAVRFPGRFLKVVGWLGGGHVGNPKGLSSMSTGRPPGGLEGVPSRAAEAVGNLGTALARLSPLRGGSEAVHGRSGARGRALDH